MTFNVAKVASESSLAGSCDFKTFMESVSSSSFKSLAIMTGNLSVPSKNAYSRWGGKSLSSTSGGSSIEDFSFLGSTTLSSCGGDVISIAKKASVSSRRKITIPKGLRVGEGGRTIGSEVLRWISTLGSNPKTIVLS
ncbi:hypothetical protein Tco_0542333 [Tanacetum coccineum]